MLFKKLTLGIARSLGIRELFNEWWQEWWQSKSGIVAYLGDSRALVRTIYGCYLFVDTRDMSLAPQLLAHGQWEQGVAALLRRILRPGMTIIEVGANVGYFSILSASLVGEAGKVCCFEPNPRLARLLREGSEVNGMSGRIAVAEKAVWSSSTEIDFYLLRDHMGSSSANSSIHRTAQAFNDRTEKIVVQTVTLDDYRSAESGVDLLKIDAEGAELHVIQGARRLLERNPGIRMIMEFYPSNFADPDDAGRLLDLLRSLGFGWQAVDTDNPAFPPREISRGALLEGRTTELLLQRAGMSV